MTDFLPHVYGQEKVKKEWRRLLNERRLPHTMILYGDEGLGKTTAAFDLAGVLTGKSEKLWEEIRLWQRESSGKEPVVTFADHQVWYLRPMGMELKIEQFRLFLDAMATFDETVHVCIIDEAQNLTPNEIKTIITRAGEGTKMVFTGDIQQIDQPYLDSQSNGLVYMIDRMKDQNLFAHVNLVKGERSELSELASNLM